MSASADGAVDLETARAQGHAVTATGTTLVRDCGSPIDTRPLDDDPAMPEIVRAGRHLARPKRYIRDLPIEAGHPDELPALVAEQAARNPWVKLVGDWIHRDEGDLAPLWGDDVLVEAIATAHDYGARVTAHVFGADALPGLIAAGIDCIEHGTGLTDDTVAAMAARDVALVPTMINVENFPDFADAAGERFPRYGAHMRDLYARADATIGAAIEAGVRVYAGTDAGGGITHGRIADEVAALHRVGMTPAAALGAACWSARSWLGRPGLDAGAPPTSSPTTATPRGPRRAPAPAGGAPGGDCALDGPQRRPRRGLRHLVADRRRRPARCRDLGERGLRVPRRRPRDDAAGLRARRRSWRADRGAGLLPRPCGLRPPVPRRRPGRARRRRALPGRRAGGDGPRGRRGGRLPCRTGRSITRWCTTRGRRGPSSTPPWPPVACRSSGLPGSRLLALAAEAGLDAVGRRSRTGATPPRARSSRGVSPGRSSRVSTRSSSGRAASPPTE